MNSTIKAAVGAALLGAFSMSAFATSVTPPSAGPTPNPGLVPGGLVALVYDTNTSTALLEWLGPDSTSFGAPSATPAAGETLDYGVLGGASFGTLFSSAEVSAGNVKFSVTAFDNTNTSVPVMDTTQATTAPAKLTLNGLKSDAGLNVTGISSNLNGLSNCNSVNPCTGTSPSSAAYTAIADFTPAGSVGAAGGAALYFYQVVGAGSALTAQVFNQFANATGAATWSLSSAGDLVYTVPSPSAVPVPAALWLLGSGLLGLGGVARRKTLTA